MKAKWFGLGAGALALALTGCSQSAPLPVLPATPGGSSQTSAPATATPVTTTPAATPLAPNGSTAPESAYASPMPSASGPTGTPAPSSSSGDGAPMAACPVGSTEDQGGTPTPGQLTMTGLRAGGHDCYDRLVVDLGGSGTPPGFQAGYVPQVTQDGSGKPVDVKGSAFLRVAFGAAPHDAQYQPTYDLQSLRSLDLKGLTMVQEVAPAGAFEGVTTIAVGLKERAPYAVSYLDDGGKPRLVIDILHKG